MPRSSVRGAWPLDYADTGPSPRIWSECPWDDIGDGGSLRGSKFFDDFDHWQKPAAAGDGGKWTTFFDTSCTILQLTDKSWGELVMTTAATDDDDCIIQAGGNAAGTYRFIDPVNLPAGVTTTHDIWFETRIKTSSIAASSGGFFIGLMDESSAAAAGVFTTGNVLVTTKNYIGFVCLNSAPTVLNFVYQRASVAGVIQPIATLHTLVADTYAKVGFTYRYAANPADRRICVYATSAASPNVPLLNPTGVTKASIEATTFPDGDPLVPTFGLTAAQTGATRTATADWIKVASVEN